MIEPGSAGSAAVPLTAISNADVVKRSSSRSPGQVSDALVVESFMNSAI
jgi:hypothetical protein